MLACQVVELDLCSMASVRSCAQEVLARFPTLDVLINNAGVYHMGLAKRHTTRDGYEEHVQVCQQAMLYTGTCRMANGYGSMAMTAWL